MKLADYLAMSVTPLHEAPRAGRLAQRLMEALADGPKTSRELQQITGYKSIYSALSDAHAAGFIHVVGEVPANALDKRRTHKVWGLI